MPNTFLTSSKILRRSLPIFENNLVAGRFVNKEYSNQYAQTGGKIGDTVSVRKPPRFLVETGEAMVAQDIEAMTAAYAEDFTSDQGGGKAEMKEFLNGAKEQGFLDEIQVDLSNLVIAVDGEKATAKPIDLEGAFGALTVEFELQKRDGQWFVTYQSQY